MLWRRRVDLPPPGQDRLWLFVVARHVLANHRRRAVRDHQLTAVQTGTILDLPAGTVRTRLRRARRRLRRHLDLQQQGEHDTQQPVLSGPVSSSGTRAGG